MKYLIAMIIGLVLLALAACGGGDSSDGGSSNEGSSTPPPIAFVESDEAPTSMHDLVVPQGFDYSPVKSSTLSVDISSFSIQRAHLSLYKQWEWASTKYTCLFLPKIKINPLLRINESFSYIVVDDM